MSKVRRIAVVGGGVAGALTALRLAEASVPVDLYTVLPPRRSPSAGYSDGVAAALDTSGSGDDTELHFEDTITAGAFLAHQPSVRSMVEAAPRIVEMLARMGVPWNRTPEGSVDLARQVGTRAPRVAFAGATTGQLIARALDDQLYRVETALASGDRGLPVPGEQMLRRFEAWEFLGIVQDDAGTCVGLVAQDLRSMVVKAAAYDAVVIATGSPAAMFDASAASLASDGSAAAFVLQQGAVYANPEFLEVQPTAAMGSDKRWIVTDLVRAAGARLWVPKDAADERAPREILERERDYLLERVHPLGNLAPHEVAAHAMLEAVAAGHAFAYLDLGQRDEASLRRAFGAALDTYAKLTGEAGGIAPMKVVPAMVGSLGGLWVDHAPAASGSSGPASPRNHATSIPGLYAVGDVACAYHGASRLGGHGLLACVFGALATADAVTAYRSAMERSAADLPRSIFDKAAGRHEDEYAAIAAGKDERGEVDSPYVIFDELRAALTEGLLGPRSESALTALEGRLDELEERAGRASAGDDATTSNAGAPFVRRLRAVFPLARVVAGAAKRRTESRGAHQRTDHPDRDDAVWLKTTLVVVGDGAPRFLPSFDYASAGTSVTVTEKVDTTRFGPGSESSRARSARW